MFASLWKSLLLCIRLIVGLLVSSKLVSVVRLSQLAKFTMALSSFFSVLNNSLTVQNIYMCIMGITVGMVAPTDTILISECVQEDRNFALALFLLSDAVSTLIAATSSGYILDFFQYNYNLLFTFYAACFVLAATLTVVMGCKLKRRETSQAWMFIWLFLLGTINYYIKINIFRKRCIVLFDTLLILSSWVISQTLRRATSSVQW